MLLIFVGLLGGLIYLIYLPFKIRLIRNGKLTLKHSKRINWIYLGFLCFVVLFLFFFKGDRTPSKDRLENISDVKLPHDIKVIKDEYEDMGQDFCIIYILQFNDQGAKEFSTSIRKSKYFNTLSLYKNFKRDSTFMKIKPEGAIWIKTYKGYEFSTYGCNYTIYFDTISYKLEYQECQD